MFYRKSVFFTGWSCGVTQRAVVACQNFLLRLVTFFHLLIPKEQLKEKVSLFEFPSSFFNSIL